MEGSDEENIDWQSLSLATGRLLSKKQVPTESKEGAADRECGEAGKENPNKERDDINRRLREVTARLETLDKKRM